MRSWFWLVAGLAVAALAAVACTGGGGGESAAPAGAPSTSLTQSDGGEGGVTVQVTWLTAADLQADGDLADAAASYDAASYLLLRVRMDTHSGDLNGYDPVAGSELVSDGGTAQPAVSWHSLSDDAHHRDGVLVFERPQGAGSVELTLRDLAGVARRVFRWAPPPEA
jgi:hypothetical protein